ncbi:MAG TPA: hypothetical protein VE175_13350 [Woeseiaceae bacterium]|nr:hypothetical protein [Woeseiaceae bacterium]
MAEPSVRQPCRLLVSRVTGTRPNGGTFRTELSTNGPAAKPEP